MALFFRLYKIETDKCVTAKMFIVRCACFIQPGSYTQFVRSLAPDGAQIDVLVVPPAPPPLPLQRGAASVDASVGAPSVSSASGAPTMLLCNPNAGFYEFAAIQVRW